MYTNVKFINTINYKGITTNLDIVDLVDIINNKLKFIYIFIQNPNALRTYNIY